MCRLGSGFGCGGRRLWGVNDWCWHVSCGGGAGGRLGCELRWDAVDSALNVVGLVMRLSLILILWLADLFAASSCPDDLDAQPLPALAMQASVVVELTDACLEVGSVVLEARVTLAPPRPGQINATVNATRIGRCSAFVDVCTNKYIK